MAVEGTVQQQASKRARRGKQITGLRQRHRRPPGGAWVVQRLPSRSGRWRSRLPCRAASAELKTERDGVHEQTGSRCRCWAPGPGQSLLDPAYISPLRSRLRVQSITKGVSSIPAVLRKGRVITDVLAEPLHRKAASTAKKRADGSTFAGRVWRNPNVPERLPGAHNARWWRQSMVCEGIDADYPVGFPLTQHPVRRRR